LINSGDLKVAAVAQIPVAFRRSAKIGPELRQDHTLGTKQGGRNRFNPLPNRGGAAAGPLHRAQTAIPPITQPNIGQAEQKRHRQRSRIPFARADGSSRYTYPLSETQRFNADGVAVFVRKHVEAVRVLSRDGLQGQVSLAARPDRMVLAPNANTLRSNSHGY